MGWTQDQEKAIYAPFGNGNILVSAAAGSGKTAVLVERVLQKIISGKTSIDRLLIVTFTEAAAAEMREKIIKRLINEMSPDKHSYSELKILKAQIHLAESADIMTIDAFCNRVVQNNFHVLGTDPNISIADSAMCSMLRETAMETLFERLYKTDDSSIRERFSRLIDAYASNRDDTGLSDVIFYVYKFISSFADPEQWLDKAAENYTMPPVEMPHAKYLKNNSYEAAKHCSYELDIFIRDTKSNALSEYAKELKAAADLICTKDEWDDIFEIYDIHFKKKRGKAKGLLRTEPTAESDEYFDDENRLKYIRSAFLDRLNHGITVSSTELTEQCDNHMLKAEADDIVWIVKEFMKEYMSIKDKHGVREFADIEHLTYTLFRDHDDIRMAYSDKYDEILIDEYQDTNGLQDAVFSMISHDNIFMVGDLKQSIYRFRGGDPYIFKNKSELYDSESSGDTKIVLSQNFRSRTQILNSVNDVFSCIMSRSAGDVEYTGSELIVRDKEREYYPPLKGNGKSELHYLLVNDGDKGLAEIRFTTEKIAELLNSGTMVYDKDSETMRPIRCRDIVILENSVKSNGELIVNELAKHGIDAFTETESFFGRREINIMLSLISIITNAHQDIPLIAVMRSPIGGFSENDLVKIRLAYHDSGDYINALRYYAFSKNAGTLNKKVYKFVSGRTSRFTSKRHLQKRCAAFIYNLRRWRGYVRSKSVAQLIWAIYEETYFYDIMGAIEEGEEAQFNLRLLYERARQFELAGFKGLFNFAKYIERIESSNEDLSGAKLIGENHDVVRIMTIHKSKGLEFPYVFVIGCGKRFMRKNDINTILLHKELGIGLPYIYHDEHYMRDTKIKELIADVNKTELTSELMRLLYVALTRAREKLYIVVSSKADDNITPDTLNEKWESVLSCGKMLPSAALNALGFFDWICPAAYSSKETWEVIYHFTDSIEEEENSINEEQNNYDDSEELRKAVYKILDYSYPYSESHIIPSRTSVTQLKELSIERENTYNKPVYEPDSRRTSGTDDLAELMFSPLHSKPSFMLEKDEKPANEIGTLYHLVMSEINIYYVLHEGTDCIKSELERMICDKIISEDDMRYISVEKISDFFNSETGQRMIKSHELHREQPFQINISAREYDPSLPPEYEGETVILQGIIDCFFMENGRYILIDYKTDKVKNGDAKAIRNKYSKQLELYKKAIEQLTGKEVSECLLYLFDTSQTI